MNDTRPIPLLQDKDHRAAAVFTAASLLREGRRQRRLGSTPVPSVRLLDPDGDVVRHLSSAGLAERHRDWACYHSELWTTRIGGREVGIVGNAVGGPYAVLVAEQLAESGCDLVISVTSAGRIVPLGEPPYFVLVTESWRDEGTSFHYLPPGDWAHLAPGLTEALHGAFDDLDEAVHRGRSWTTDAPYREIEAAIAAARGRAGPRRRDGSCLPVRLRRKPLARTSCASRTSPTTWPSTATTSKRAMRMAPIGSWRSSRRSPIACAHFRRADEPTSLVLPAGHRTRRGA